MATKETINKWIKQVREDISSAECLLQGGHYLYVGFLCHQAIEKMLKAYYMATHDDDPRYTHRHLVLVEDCELMDEISEEHLKFIDFMVPMYIKARYPEEKDKVSRMLNKKNCQFILKNTKDLTQWIEQRLPNKKPSKPSENTNG